LKPGISLLYSLENLLYEYKVYLSKNDISLIDIKTLPLYFAK
jgi:hypothetical protein